jgi:signal transduction histidine kinase
MSEARAGGSGHRHDRRPSSARSMELAALAVATDDEAMLLRRAVAWVALPGGLDVGRAFLFVVDHDRAELVGRHAVGPLDARETERFPANGEPYSLDATLAQVDDDDLESAAPELTRRVRAIALPLAPGKDPAVDVCLAGGAARLGGDGTAVPKWGERVGLAHGLAAAVHAFGRPVALLVADSGFRPRRATGEDLALLTHFARLVGHALERARLTRRELERTSQLSTLEELGKSALGATSLRTELALLVRAGTQALGCRGGLLWRVHGDRPALLLETVHSAEDRVDPLRQAESLEPLSALALKDRLTRNVADATREAALDPAAVVGVGAVLALPLPTPGAPLGVLVFHGPEGRPLDEPAAFSEDDLHVAETIAAQAAAVLTLARLSDRVRAAETRLRELSKHVATNERLAALGSIAGRAAEAAQAPLASIAGFARRVHRGLAAEDPNREYMEIILRESDRLERLLTEHLQFASLSRSRLALGSVNQILAEVLTAVSDGMVKRRVRLLKKLAPDVPNLLLDAERIRQVVTNMLDHAVDRVPSGGRVRVETRKSQGYVVVEIASDAPPLSGDMLEQLFVPFTAAKKAGDPIGLALAQQVVHSHGGEIRVRSEGDWGVIFSFTLPVGENADRRRANDRRGVRLDRRNRFPAA